LKSAELPQSPDRHQREARVIPFPVHKTARSGYRAFDALFVAAWLLFLGAISFLAMVVR
jgi:hypothetical protein